MKPDLPHLDPLADADWEAIARYLADESPPAEAAAVRAWLDEDPRRSEIVLGLDDSLDTLADPPPADLDVEGALASVLRRAEEPVVTPLRPARPAGRASAPRPWTAPVLRIAALVVLLVGGIWLLRQVVGGAPEVAEAPRVYESEVGQRLAVRLGDGSEIILAPASRVEVDPGFGTETRTVALRGEALFEVVHDERRPFVVVAGDAVIRDLGTTFAVRTLTGDGVRVAVTEGRVALRSGVAADAPEVELGPGDRGILVAGSPPVAERGAPVDDDLAWVAGRLVFDDTPMAEVAADLERWYGVQVQIADAELARRVVTATFETEPVDGVVRAIALALGADAQVRGDSVIFRAAADGSR